MTAHCKLAHFFGFTRNNKHVLMKTLILTAALGTLAAGANAQIRFGAEVGVQMANLVTTVPDFNNPGKSEHIDSKPNLGLRGGLVAQFGITDNFSIQPALLFAMKGARLENDDEYSLGSTTVKTSTQIKTNLNYIELPINFQYNMNSDGTGFFVGAGPYIGYAFAGKLAGDESTEMTTAGVTVSTKTEIDQEVSFGDGLLDNYKNLDIGVGLNAGYMLPMGAFVRAFGQYGFSNIYPSAIAALDGKTRNYGFGLTVGYMIGGGE